MRSDFFKMPSTDIPISTETIKSRSGSSEFYKSEQIAKLKTIFTLNISAIYKILIINIYTTNLQYDNRTTCGVAW